MAWMAGAARTEVTCWEPGMHLFGWGIVTNVSNDVATPMFARALVVESDGQAAAIVVIDIGVITATLRRHALEALRHRHPSCPIDDEHILLSATHTHSGPSGYSEHLFYGLSGPGLSQHVVATYADGIADAIARAWDSRESADLRVVSDELPRHIPIVFNRSLGPYHQNREMLGSAPVSTDEATDRRMTLLRCTRATDGSPIGVVAWFATHATSIHADNQKIHGDHRGLAARDFEAQLHTRFGRPTVTMFPQEAAGDVSPNFRWDAKRKRAVGAKENDEDSAQFVADALRTFAATLFDAADRAPRLPATVAGSLRYVEMPGFTYEDADKGGEPVTLADAVLGVGFIEGTLEGPGPLQPIRGVNRRITNLFRPEGRFANREIVKGHGNKIPFLETGRGLDGRVFGLFRVRHAPRMAFLDATVATYLRYKRLDALDENPWSPTVLPFQVLRIGSLLLATIPAEPTTTVGRRLRATLAAVTAAASGSERPSMPAEHVVIAGYSNDYAAYVTTSEEYFAQWYEGASTMFGPQTFGGMQAILSELTQHVWHDVPVTLPSAQPHAFDPALFLKRAYRRKDRQVR